MEEIFLFIQEEILIVAALVALIIIFLRRESAAAGAKLSCSQVVQAMNSDKALLLDVRESKDFDQGHIANAINIPHGKLVNSLGQLEKHREKQIIVADNLGQHSGMAARTLLKAGFSVARLRGGIGEWKQDGLPLVK